MAVTGEAPGLERGTPVKVRLFTDVPAGVECLRDRTLVFVPWHASVVWIPEALLVI
jgi:hypothetical protein